MGTFDDRIYIALNYIECIIDFLYACDYLVFIFGFLLKVERVIMVLK